MIFSRPTDGLPEFPAPVTPPQLPAGIYTVHTRRAEAVGMFKGRRLLLYAEIVGGPYKSLETPELPGGPHFGAILFWACTLPLTGKRPAHSSKLNRAWLLTAGRRPNQGERISPRMLVGKRFRASVETVSRDHSGQVIPEPVRYSVIRQLLRREA
jgi:hypothetical protein